MNDNNTNQAASSLSDLERKQHIAQLAGAMTGMLIETMTECAQEGMDAHDVTFASLLSLRSVTTMHFKDEELAKVALRKVFEQAMEQPLLTKRFRDEGEMRAWLEQEGLGGEPGANAGSAYIPPKGPMH